MSIDKKCLIVSIVIMLIALINVSFAYVVSFDNSSTIYKIDAGTFNVLTDVIKEDKNYIMKSNIIPTSSNDIITGEYSTISINNMGSIDSRYEIIIDENNSNNVSFDDLYFGLYDEYKNEWVKYNDNYYTHFNNNDYKKILYKGVVKSRELKKYKLYIWLVNDVSMDKEVNLNITINNSVSYK